MILLPKPSLPACAGLALLLALAAADARAQAEIGGKPPSAAEDEVAVEVAVEAVPAGAGAAKATGKKVETRTGESRRSGAEPAAKSKPSPEFAGSRAVILPAETETAIIARWQRRLEHLAARDVKRADEEETQIERIRDDLGFENLFSVATALIREADDLIATGSAAQALTRCAAAQRLAPAFGEAYLCTARAALADSPLAVGAAGRAMFAALSATLADVRSGRNAVNDEVLTGLFALVIACGALVLLLIARYAGLFLHDFHHLFPKGASRWQTGLVALILIALPAVLGFGAVGPVALFALAVSLYLSRAEAIAIGSALAVLAVSQLLIGEVMRTGSFGMVANDIYLLERGDAPLASAARLEKRLGEGLGDYTSAFALGRFHKRVGELDAAATSYLAALKFQRTATAMNNLGNVRFLQGDAAAAQALYREANAADPRLPAPLANIAKMFFREGRLDQGQKAQRDALELGGEEIRGKIGVNDDMRSNLYLLDVPLPDAAIEAVAEREAERVTSIGGPAVAIVTGKSSHALAAVIVALTALAVALAQLVQRRVRPTGKCDKCGRPVCGRCDPELGAQSGLCGQCISVFVRRTGVDAPDRIRKEIEVRRFRRRQRLTVRFVGLLVGGGGHVLAGRIIGGGLFLLATSLLSSQVLFWNGFLRAPIAIGNATSPVRIGCYAALGLALYALSVRHLLKHEEAD